MERRFSINASIDADHKNIILRINEIIKSILNEGNIFLISFAINELYKVTEAHFFREESIQEILNFPYLEEHQYEHKSLLSALHDWIKIIEYTSKKDNIIMQKYKLKQCKAFLYRWIFSHILEEDKKLGEYMRDVQFPNDVLAQGIDDLAAYVAMPSSEGGAHLTSVCEGLKQNIGLLRPNRGAA